MSPEADSDGGSEWKICRACLAAGASVPVCTWRDGVQVSAMMMKCAAVVVAVGDGLPAAICERCSADLDAAFEFAARCEAADSALRALPRVPAELHDIRVKTEIECDYDAGCEPDSGSERKQPAVDGSKTVVNSTTLDTTSPIIKVERSEKKLRPPRKKGMVGPQRCPVCSMSIASRSALDIHMRSHTKERPYTCDLCKKSYRTKDILKRHILGHYGRGPKKIVRKACWQCSVCGQLAACRAALEAHARVHSGERPFACAHCPARFRLKGVLRRHEACRHPALTPDAHFVCEHCGKMFRSRANIAVHLRIHSGDRPYRCERCPARFSQYAGLSRHRRVHTGETPYACAVCARTFRDSATLARHALVHSAARPHACTRCDKTFKTRQALLVHEVVHSGVRAWRCDDCDATFSSKGNLTQHARRLHGAGAGQCPACGRHVPDLAAHVREHAGARPHGCEHCGRHFVSRRSLSHHISFKHRDTAKFLCGVDDCQRTFPRAVMLRFHELKVHARGAALRCEMCSRVCLRACDLARHRRLHHAEPAPAPSDAPSPALVPASPIVQTPLPLVAHL